MTLHPELLEAIATASDDDLAAIAGAVDARQGDPKLDARYREALERGDADALIQIEMERARRNVARAGGAS
jgi:hypothetical protein